MRFGGIQTWDISMPTMDARTHCCQQSRTKARQRAIISSQGAVDSKWMLPDHVASQKAESAWTAMLSECSCPGGPFKASTFNCGNSIETMQKPNWKQSPYTGTNERKMKQVGPGWLNMLTVGELDLSTSPSPMLKAGVVPFPMVKFRVSVMVFQSVCNWIQ